MKAFALLRVRQEGIYERCVKRVLETWIVLSEGSEIIQKDVGRYEENDRGLRGRGGDLG